MSESNEIFSSKPKQIAEAIVEISKQIFGRTDIINIAVIGDEGMIVDIGENIKKYKFKDLITLNKPIKRFYDQKKKKIFNDGDFLKNFHICDVFLIGFKNGLKIFSKELILQILEIRKQKPLFLIEGGLPGNINPQVKNLSNIFLYDLNDLEQFFSLTQQFKDTKEKGFFIDNIDKNHYVEPFFKKLNFNDDQIRIFYNNLNSFLSKNNDDNFKNKFLSFFKLFSK